jgi:hypothetical protein
MRSHLRIQLLSSLFGCGSLDSLYNRLTHLIAVYINYIRQVLNDYFVDNNLTVNLTVTEDDIEGLLFCS